MKVYVNTREVNIMPGMTVKHALIAAGLIDMIKQEKRVYDEIGNEVGLEGELAEGEKIYVGRHLTP